MDVIMDGIQWFIGLGSTVFLPVIIFIIGLFFGLKPSKAFISGVTVGIYYRAVWVVLFSKWVKNLELL